MKHLHDFIGQPPTCYFFPGYRQTNDTKTWVHWVHISMVQFFHGQCFGQLQPTPWTDVRSAVVQGHFPILQQSHQCRDRATRQSMQTVQHTQTTQTNGVGQGCWQPDRFPHVIGGPSIEQITGCHVFKQKQRFHLHVPQRCCKPFGDQCFAFPSCTNQTHILAQGRGLQHAGQHRGLVGQ